MNKVAKNKLNMNARAKDLPFQLLPLLFFFFMSIVFPLPSLGQDSPSLSEKTSKRQGLKSNASESIGEQGFLILKERLDRLSKQTVKHRRKSSAKIPEYIEKEDLNLSPFPEISGADSFEDILLILKKRLADLHHVLSEES